MTISRAFTLKPISYSRLRDVNVDEYLKLSHRPPATETLGFSGNAHAAKPTAATSKAK